MNYKFRATMMGGHRVHDFDGRWEMRCGLVTLKAIMSGLPTNCPKCMGRRLLRENAIRRGEVTA